MDDRNDVNDKENEKSSMRRIARGLQFSCHSCHLCHWGGEGRWLTRQADHCFLPLANIIQTKPATIDINGFAGDIASFVTGQKHDGVGHILYVAKPAKRGS